MKQKLSSKKLELYEFIEKLFYEEWNPIDVDGLPEDEYESYVPSIFYMAIYGINTEQITEKLLSIEQDMMVLKGNRQHCLEMAVKIVNKKTELLL